MNVMLSALGRCMDQVDALENGTQQGIRKVSVRLNYDDGKGDSGPISHAVASVSLRVFGMARANEAHEMPAPVLGNGEEQRVWHEPKE